MGRRPLAGWIGDLSDSVGWRPPEFCRAERGRWGRCGGLRGRSLGRCSRVVAPFGQAERGRLERRDGPPPSGLDVNQKAGNANNDIALRLCIVTIYGKFDQAV